MSAPPPPYNDPWVGDNHVETQPHILREDKFRSIINKHEISLDFAQRIQKLQGFKIAFIFDDSGSMNSTLSESPLNNNNTLMRATRWDELKYFATISIEIASLFDTEG